MWEIFQKILFFCFVMPYMLAEKVYHMINARLEKQGYSKLDPLYIALALLFILLITLWILGYR